jgi:hypothetical protein
MAITSDNFNRSNANLEGSTASGGGTRSSDERILQSSSRILTVLPEMSSLTWAMAIGSRRKCLGALGRRCTTAAGVRLFSLGVLRQALSSLGDRGVQTR